jgi:hypothetical protein
MKRRDWLDVALQVLNGAGAVFIFALLLRPVSADLGLALLYGSGLAALAGVVFLAVWALLGRVGE